MAGAILEKLIYTVTNQQSGISTHENKMHDHFRHVTGVMAAGFQ
jgi:hypothetical protein